MLRDELKREIYRISWQQRIYMALNAFLLVFFGMILFLSAKKYHDLTLWGVGVCLMIFALIEFLDLDFRSSGHAILDPILKADEKRNE